MTYALRGRGAVGGSTSAVSGVIVVLVSALPPPGWYPDETMSATQRYWDGQRWTDQVAPTAPAPTPSEGVAFAKSLLILVGCLGAAVLMIMIAAEIVRG
jgi:hypothetical protein